MIWIVISIIIAGYLIAQAIRHRAVIEATSSEALRRQRADDERQRLASTPEYRKMYRAIDEFIEMNKNRLWYIYLAEDALLDVAKNPKRDAQWKRDRRAQAKEHVAEAASISKVFWASRSEDDPYNPERIPFTEWPQDLWGKYRAWVEDRQDEISAISDKRHKLEAQ